MQPDERISKRYREMAREAPDAALDAAILAASRRALRPSAARRWGVPVSIAAVLVLAFGLTLEMRHEEPGIETSLPGPAPAAPPPKEEEKPAGSPTKDAIREAAPAATAKPAVPAAREAKPAKPLEKMRIAPPAAEREAPAAFPAAPPSPAAAPPPPQAPQAADLIAPTPRRAEAPEARRPPAAEMNAAPAFAPRAKASAETMQRAQGAVAASPEMRELERIAQLRADGHDAEADKALEDFRRDHPGYRIPEAMWERVKAR